jgi:signal transduction histidine kinase
MYQSTVTQGSSLQAPFFLMAGAIFISILSVALKSTKPVHRETTFYLWVAALIILSLHYTLRSILLLFVPSNLAEFDFTYPEQRSFVFLYMILVILEFSLTIAFFRTVSSYRINLFLYFIPLLALVAFLTFDSKIVAANLSITRGLITTWALTVMAFEIRQNPWCHSKNSFHSIYIGTIFFTVSSIIFLLLSLYPKLTSSPYVTDFKDLSNSALGDLFSILRTMWFVIIETLICIFWLEKFASNAIEVTEQKIQLEQLIDEKDLLIENLLKAKTLIHSGALSAGVSHELNQFLAVIQLNAEQASLSLKTSNDPTAIDVNLNRIIKVNRSASDVIIKLKRLFISRENTPAPTVMNEIISFVTDLHQKRMDQGNIQIELQLNTYGRIAVVESLIQQVISNLLVNAIEALERSVQPNKKISIRTDLIEKECLIRISDNGPGIDPTISRKIFNLFETTKSSGTGIGLWLSQHIVERHEGKLTYQANETEGVTFTVALPLNPTANKILM